MRIYPKIANQEMSEDMKKIIGESYGAEIQFFDENGITSEFNFEDVVRKFKKEYPNLKELTIHPPLNNYNFEMVVFKDRQMIERQLDTAVKLSEELDIDLNFLFHVYMTKNQYIAIGLMDILNEMIKKLDNTRVTVLMENLYMMLDEKTECSVIEICKYINNRHLMACIDTTHVHCKANIYKKNFYELIENDFKKEECEKFVKQIHFASALQNDGYIDKRTHGRRHENEETLYKELDWLRKYGMADKNYVTEVSEEDYYTRVDQIEEIKMLKKAVKSI